jgi:hypothetical protein
MGPQMGSLHTILGPSRTTASSHPNGSNRQVLKERASLFSHARKGDSLSSPPSSSTTTLSRDSSGEPLGPPQSRDYVAQVGRKDQGPPDHPEHARLLTMVARNIFRYQRILDLEMSIVLFSKKLPPPRLAFHSRKSLKDLS